MMFPTIHLNGTSKGRLLDAYTDAADALREAIEKLAETAPNARDYYVQGPDAFSKAADEHAERMLKVQSVLSDMEMIAWQVMNPGEKPVR